MSTNADIIIETLAGYKSIYLHNDGMPERALKMLQTHYTDRAKVEALIKLGNISILGESIDRPEGHSFENPVRGYTVAYGRDRGETNQQAEFNRMLDYHKANQYSYLFNSKDEWVML